MKTRCIAALCALIALLVAAGCATVGGGGTGLPALKARTHELAAAASARDIDRLMSCLEADFECPQIGDKASFKTFLEAARDAGDLDGMEIDISQAQYTTVDSATAEVAPVTIRGSFGEGKAIFTATNTTGIWLMAAMELSGI